MLFCFHWLLLFRFGGLIGVNDRSLFAVRSVVFVLRRNVQLLQPEVCFSFHDDSILYWCDVFVGGME